MDKKYKPGQLITFKNHVYRITNCKAGCSECKYSELHHIKGNICVYCVDVIYTNIIKYGGYICYKLVLVK